MGATVAMGALVAFARSRWGVRLQTRRGLDMIRQVASQGIGVVIITHIMQQAFQVADRIVVIRQGVVAGDVERSKTSPDAVISMITGETFAGAGPAG